MVITGTRARGLNADPFEVLPVHLFIRLTFIKYLLHDSIVLGSVKVMVDKKTYGAFILRESSL